MAIQEQVVVAASVADYIIRYYKADRRLDHDRAYGEGSLTRAYEAELERDGYICTSHHDNVTGAFIYWPCRPEEVSRG